MFECSIKSNHDTQICIQVTSNQRSSYCKHCEHVFDPPEKYIEADPGEHHFPEPNIKPYPRWAPFPWTIDCIRCPKRWQQLKLALKIDQGTERRVLSKPI